MWVDIDAFMSTCHHACHLHTYRSISSSLASASLVIDLTLSKFFLCFINAADAHMAGRLAAFRPYAPALCLLSSGVVSFV